MDNMVGAVFVGATMVGGDQATVTTDAGGGTAHGETHVHGQLALNYGFGGAIGGSTVIAATPPVVHVVTSGAISTSTTTHGDLVITILHGQTIIAGTVVSGRYPTGLVQLRAASVGHSGVHGQLTGQWGGAGAVVCRSTVHAALGRLDLLTSGVIAGSTVVHAVAPDIYLLPATHISTRTTVGAYLTEQVLALAPRTVSGRTTVRAVFAAHYLFGGAPTGSTAIKGRLHVYPEDFQDVRIYSHTTVTGGVTFSSRLASGVIAGRTRVSALAAVRLMLHAGLIAGKTSIKGNLRYAFGNDIIGRTTARGRVGIQTGINTWKGWTIQGRTRIVAQPPENYFKGICAGRTTVTTAMTIAYAVTGTTVTTTSFHSHFPGRTSHDGPVGSVNLTTVPRGDLGTASEIDGSSALSADITIERHRLMVVFGNVGVSVPKNLIVEGTVVAGPETRYVGGPLEAPVPVRPYGVLYV